MTPDERVEAAVARIRADPELLARYDVTGDGELDEREWELVRRMVELELRTAAERRAPWSLDLELRTLNDRFEVIGLLGRGGQAYTHLARDLEQGGKHVVVKELAVRVAADWKSIELFEREAQVLERLTHPAIPRYVDAFHADDDGGDVRFMLVQDFVDGFDLGSFVAGGARWTEAEAVRRMLELSDILAYLHMKKPAVIHRDIKPSNLIVGRDDRLYLVDFGAVQTVIPTTVGGSTIIGTTGYIPMEQYMGRAEPATDLYALGATVVHLLSGTHPADLPMRGGGLVIDDHVDVGEDLRAVLKRLLEPAIENRLGSAAELATALGRSPGAAPLAPPEPPELPEPHERAWTVLSTPENALVLGPDGERLGTTPLEVTLLSARLPATLTLTASQPGFRGASVRLTTMTVSPIHVSLIPRRALTRLPAAPEAVPREPGAYLFRVTNGPDHVSLRSGPSVDRAALFGAPIIVFLVSMLIAGPAGAIFVVCVALPLVITVGVSGSSLRLEPGAWRLDGNGRFKGTTDDIVGFEVTSIALVLLLRSGERLQMPLNGELNAGEREWVRQIAAEHLRAPDLALLEE